jgi:sulfhydrogenase subunit beta (sulfur reductase)
MPLDAWTLQKEQLPAFLETLRSEYRVVVPKRVGPSEVLFDDYAAGVRVPLDYVNSTLPPKDLFFPRRETLFEIQGSKAPTLAPPAPEKPVAIFGLRSCDATGLAYLEKFFAERGFEDDTVVGRIKASLRLTLACHAPGPECFCVCCDGGPFLSTGFDLQFADLGQAFLVEAGTERGSRAVRGAQGLFTPAGSEHLRAKAQIVERVDSTFTRRSYMSDGIKRITLDKIPQEKWEAWAADCQNCGGCCFVCPTCSCFTVRDAWRGPDSFAREKTWDACLYAGFTREASGHNPRAKRAERTKRRFFHKMSYQYVELMGRHGCVGCGRCVDTCMGCLDISSLLERIKNECP